MMYNEEAIKLLESVRDKLEELKNIASFFRVRMIEIKDKILELSIKEKKLKMSIDKVNSQLASLNNKK